MNKSSSAHNFFFSDYIVGKFSAWLKYVCLIACDSCHFYRLWRCGVAPISFNRLSKAFISSFAITILLLLLLLSFQRPIICCLFAQLGTYYDPIKLSETFPYPRSLQSPTLLRTMASSAMSKRLEGKTIVITGASSGIGKSTAIEFARTSPKNLKLVLTARRVDKLKEIAEQIKTEVGDGVKVLPVKLDISNPEEVRGFVGGLPEEFREIDVLVNNA